MVSFSSTLPNQLGYTLVTDEFQLRFIHRIGKGAYGQVYLAWDMSTPETAPKFYAVKCTFQYDAGSEFSVLQRKEIAFHCAMSDHPNITTLHDIIVEDGFNYMVMDYHEGGDLYAAIMNRQSFYRNDDAVKMAFVQLIDAVDACHDLGISHRDLKPENIMCSQGDSRIFLSDFGLATQSGLSSSYGCGSGHYMSPECIGSAERFVPYSPRRSDIWSLGIILVNMLTGRNPWQWASAARDEGFARYLRNRPFFLSCILALSDEAAELLSHILDPDPRTRMTLRAMREAVLNVGTFFPADDCPGYLRLAQTPFYTDLEELYAEAEAPWADEDDSDSGMMEMPREELIEVEFDMRERRPTSVQGLISIPLNSPPSEASTFVNQHTSISSVETDETLPPVTPVSAVSEIPGVVSHLALAAEGAQVVREEDGHQEAGAGKGMQRMMDVVRRVGLWA